MNVQDFCVQILSNGDLDSKLLSTKLIDWEDDNPQTFWNDTLPKRNHEITFSDKQIKFPKKGSLHQNKSKALALHFFANHELMAIELFAWAIVQFPEISKDEKKRLILTLSDEQKHFKLYQKRIQRLGVSFGDYPVNDFFWRIISQSSSIEQFYSLMALTFEQANLDFMSFYLDCFKSIGDEETAAILNIIYEDEISHVQRGARFLRNDTQELWDIYQSYLPKGVTPARGKGMTFDKDARKKAGLDEHFIQQMNDYQDSFKVTKRKEWK